MALWGRDYIKERKPNQFKFNESKGEVEFDKQQQQKLKEFKKVWKVEDDTIKSFSFIPWIVALLVILAISKEIHKHSISNKASPTTEQSINIFEPAAASELLPPPSTSVLSTVYNTTTATCPFTIIADNKNYYIKLSDKMRGGKTVAKFFVRAGEELKTTVPAGQYILKFGSGKEWYGEKELFGRYSQYGKSENLDFSSDGFSSNGQIISFYKSADGNLHTDNVGRDTILQD